MDRGRGRARRLNPGWLLGVALAGAAAPAYGTEPELLHPAEAFRLEVSRPAPHRIRLRWVIAEGYYLYRERLRFRAEGPATLEPPTLPPGKVKDDPFFGVTEIYRHRLAVDLTLERAGAGEDAVAIRVTSQGCADLGVCFPPETRRAALRVGETVRPAPDPDLEPGGGAFPGIAPAGVWRKKGPAGTP